MIEELCVELAYLNEASGSYDLETGSLNRPEKYQTQLFFSANTDWLWHACS